jgi:hypothetical protein
MMVLFMVLSPIFGCLPTFSSKFYYDNLKKTHLFFTEYIKICPPVNGNRPEEEYL